MSKDKKLPTLQIPKAQELLDFSMELAKLHLSRLKEKAGTPEGLTPHEGNCVGQYVKTFTSIAKLERDLERQTELSLAKMSDEELKKELEKFAKMANSEEGSDD